MTNYYLIVRRSSINRLSGQTHKKVTIFAAGFSCVDFVQIDFRSSCKNAGCNSDKVLADLMKVLIFMSEKRLAK